MLSSDKVLKICFILQIYFLKSSFVQAYQDELNNEKEVTLGFTLSKDYVIPKTSVKNKEVNDITYLLTKLSDEELVKRLSEHPKKTELNFNDFVNFAALTNNVELNENQEQLRSRFRTVTSDSKNGYFKLNHKLVKPNRQQTTGKQEEEAMFKIKNILYSRQVNQGIEDDTKKEFDLLVSQLKTLCCKKFSSKKPRLQHFIKPRLLEPLLTDFTKNIDANNTNSNNEQPGPMNYMFLIINDDISRDVSHKDGLISVDPDSLDENSSVLLLGPIIQELTNLQLKMVMNKVTEEISRPEYLPLLQQIGDGILDPENMKLMKSLVTGPDTRRYIKPHRCNYQSKLARVFLGPRWIICTGYLNINSPSLYD